MQFQYMLTLKDYFAAQALYAKRGRIFLYCISLIGAAACVFTLIAAAYRHWGSFDWLVFSVGVAWMAIPLYNRWVYARQFRRTINQSGESILNLDADLIHYQNAHSRGEMQWTMIQRFAEDGKSFLLYLAPGKFLVVPKRVCSTEQIEELRALLQAKIVPLRKK